MFITTIFVGNADMTDVFKCRKSGTKCCAPKSLIKETISGKDEVTEKETTEAPKINYATEKPVITCELSCLISICI